MVPAIPIRPVESSNRLPGSGVDKAGLWLCFSPAAAPVQFPVLNRTLSCTPLREAMRGWLTYALSPSELWLLNAPGGGAGIPLVEKWLESLAPRMFTPEWEVAKFTAMGLAEASVEKLRAATIDSRKRVLGKIDPPKANSNSNNSDSFKTFLLSGCNIEVQWQCQSADKVVLTAATTCRLRKRESEISCRCPDAAAEFGSIHGRC